jgi:hypothetical protein
MNSNFCELSRSTGFPTEALMDFVDRGLLLAKQHNTLGDNSGTCFDGLSLITFLEDIANAE